MTLAETIRHRTGLTVTVEHQDNGIFIDSGRGCAFFQSGTSIDEMVRVIASKNAELPLFANVTFVRMK